MSLPRRLLMTTDAVGGVWTYAIDLAGALSEQGVACTLAVIGPAPGLEQLARAGGVPGLDVRVMGLALDWLARDPTEVLASGQAVAALADEVGAELVHLNAPALAAGGAFARPVVAVAHSCVTTWWRCVGDGAMPAAFVWQSALVAAGYAAAQEVVAPTEAFASLTAQCHGLARAPRVVHNGRRAPTAAPAAAMADCVFTAGRLWDAGKNLAALDRVAARVAWPVVAAGPLQGPHGARIGLDHVRAIGALDGNSVAARLAARPVFISLALYEPFGLAVLEAAQAGCALILADRPGFRELWNGAAVFVPPDDDAAAALAIERMMRDRGARLDWGARAAARAGRYSVAAMAGGMAEVYRRCLGGAAELAA